MALSCHMDTSFIYLILLNILRFTRRQAAVGGIDCRLIFPSFFARNRERFTPFQCCRKCVHLFRIGKPVRNGFFGCQFAFAPKSDSDRLFHVQRVVGRQNPESPTSSIGVR